MNKEDTLVGQTLDGRFNIHALIARGGMGRVYRAEQAPLGRVCAVKVLTARAQSDQDPEFEQRFFREASICAKLTHPNTVTIFDYGRTTAPGRDGELYFMAMEYLEGRTLQRALRDDGTFDETRAVHVARQICRSLREAHSLGVIHRDLKPANVYLVEHGDERDVVKVLDFGLVKNVTEPEDEELTQAGLFMGSPKYMAPEQIRGDHVDARTDIYALGVILYELVTGKPPFARASSLDVLMAHVNEPVPPLRSMKADLAISESLEATILRCLEKSADARFATMEEVLVALRGGAVGTTTGTFSQSNPQVVDPLTRSSGHPAAASLTPQPSEILSSTSLAPAASRAPSRAVLALAAVGICGVIGIAIAIGSRHEKPQPSTTATGGAPTTMTSPSATSIVASAPASATAGTKTSLPVVMVDSDPSGARIRDAQKTLICDHTPCAVPIDGASVVVSVELDGHNTELVRVSASDPPRKVKLAKKWVPTVSQAKPAETSDLKPAVPVNSGPYKPHPYD